MAGRLVGHDFIEFLNTIISIYKLIFEIVKTSSAFAALTVKEGELSYIR